MTIPTSRKFEKKKNKRMRSSQASRMFRIFGSETRNSSRYSVGKSQGFCRYNNVLVLVHLLAFIRTELKSNDKLQYVSLQHSSSPPPPPWTLMSSIGNVDLRVDSENILIHFLPPPRGGGGYSDLVPTGVCRWSRQTRSYPSLRVILVEKGTNY